MLLLGNKAFKKLIRIFLTKTEPLNLASSLCHNFQFYQNYVSLVLVKQIWKTVPNTAGKDMTDVLVIPHFKDWSKWQNNSFPAG